MATDIVKIELDFSANRHYIELKGDPYDCMRRLGKLATDLIFAHAEPSGIGDMYIIERIEMEPDPTQRKVRHLWILKAWLSNERKSD